MSLTINAEGQRGRHYILMVDKISYVVEIVTDAPHACNIIMSDRPNPVECHESYKTIQGRIEAAKIGQRAELTCIADTLAALWHENVDIATSEGRAIVSAIDYDALLSAIAQAHDVAAAAIGRPGRLADEALKPDRSMAHLEHALDTDAEQIRVLHRVIRAARDGECLQCSANGAARFPVNLQPPAYPEFDNLAFRCSDCGFEITKDQVKVAFGKWQGIAQNNMAAWHQFWEIQESA